MDRNEEDVIRIKNKYYILATSALADERTKVLKHGETLAVFDRYGDIRHVGLGEQGLYHDGTRFLSQLELRLEDKRMLILSSLINDDNSVLAVDLSNPDLSNDGTVHLQRNTIQFVRFKFLKNGVSYERFWIRNFSLRAVDINFSIHYASDFRDMFEVRGIERKRRGQYLRPTVKSGDVTLGYRGLDKLIRQVHIQASPKPKVTKSAEMTFAANIKAKSEINYFLTYSCDVGSEKPKPTAYPKALNDIQSGLEHYHDTECRITTSNEQFNLWLNRSDADMAMMVTKTPEGPYPYAGVPWYSTPFGRDGIIAAMEVLWANPHLSKGVLEYLAANQAEEMDPDRDAEPGKILHEVRKGEMAALGEIPFGKYYGSIDSTPLFIALAGAYYQRTGDLQLIRSIWPNIKMALEWIDIYGDFDGDGFIEYARKSSDGLTQQGWKDSHDSVFHANGDTAKPPIALCEVQGYVYAAKLLASEMAHAMGENQMADELKREARALRIKFEKMFWIESMGTYALALDGEKKPCRVRTSNAGQCLFSGIAGRDHAVRVAKLLLNDGSFSGWGIRTVAEGESRFNPMSYHNGSVWPHDNALIAYGMSRYGLKTEVAKIMTGLFDASVFAELHRLPELFCGFKRRHGSGPPMYPLACAPQAWASGAIFMLLQACLGLIIDFKESRLIFRHPVLPEFLKYVEIRGLSVGKGTIDIDLRSHKLNVEFNVVRRKGNVAVVVEK